MHILNGYLLFTQKVIISSNYRKILLKNSEISSIMYKNKYTYLPQKNILNL